jgi:manganese transport protein
LLVSIGYMDPGNWATAIEAGSRFGYSLLFVVVLASLAGMVVQNLCSRLGIATGRDLAQLSRERYSTSVACGQWVLAEISILATDLAEVLGAALAFHLLLGCLADHRRRLDGVRYGAGAGIAGRGFRRLEAIMLVPGRNHRRVFLRRTGADQTLLAGCLRGFQTVAGAMC